MSEQPGTSRPRLVRAGDVPLPGAPDRTRIVGMDEPVHEPVSHEPLRERYEAPPPPPAPPSTPWRGLMAAGAGAVALGIAAGAGVHWWQGKTPEPVTTATAIASNPAAVRPDRLVRGYLESLAAGNARTALATGPAPARGSTELVEGENYAAAVQNAPVTEVHVPNQSSTTTLVPASYRVGGKLVRATFQVRRDEQGAWQMVRTTRSIRLLGTTGEVPLLINGRSVRAGSTLELLPGQYRLTSALPYVDYAGDQVTVLDLGEDAVSDHPIAPHITSAGQQRIQQVVRDALAACVEQHSMAPEGCPYSFSAQGSTAEPVQSSIVVTMDEGDLRSAQAVLDPKEPHIAVLTFTPTFKMTARYADGSTSVSAPRTEQLQARMPITGRASDPMPITWPGQ